MAASFFSTILTADARTAPDRTGAQFAAAGSQRPRLTDPHALSPWAAGHLHAETVIQIAAQAIADTPMDGLTGDHLLKRTHMVAILDATAAAVRLLALDADDNSTLTEPNWEEALHGIHKALAVPFIDPTARRVTRMQIITDEHDENVDS